jgi:hypothetical protein
MIGHFRPPGVGPAAVPPTVDGNEAPPLLPAFAAPLPHRNDSGGTSLRTTIDSERSTLDSCVGYPSFIPPPLTFHCLDCVGGAAGEVVTMGVEALAVVAATMTDTVVAGNR